MNTAVSTILLTIETELKEFNPKEKCRLCLVTHEPSNLLDFNSGNPKISQSISMSSILSDCFKIEFYQDKDLPDRVCTNCASIIFVVKVFRENILKCQELLNNHLNKTQQREANIQSNPLEAQISNDLQSAPAEKDTKKSKKPLHVKSVHRFENGKESRKSFLVDHDYLKQTDPNVVWWSRKRKPPYICKICGNNFGDRYKTFYQHVKKHTVIKIPCEYCGKRYIRNMLKEHLRIHTNEKPYLCTECPAQFRIASTLRSHMRRHTGEKLLYICEICGKAYTLSSNLSAHISKEHGSKSSKRQTTRRKQCEKKWSHYCERCNKGFKSLIGLKCHSRLKSDSYCKSCCKDFSTPSNLRVHKLWHEVKLKENNTSDFQKWICDICNTEYNGAESLANHIITHMENWKILTCTTCNKNFTSKFLYNLHLKSHKGCRPFTCGICSKSFAKATQLKGHLRTHAADKPYECKICLKSFTTNPYLLSHMITHGYTWDNGCD